MSETNLTSTQRGLPFNLISILSLHEVDQMKEIRLDLSIYSIVVVPRENTFIRGQNNIGRYQGYNKKKISHYFEKIRTTLFICLCYNL